MTTELLVAGSVALDTLDGPFGTVTDELGGSALYFALAASLIAPVRMIAPIGRESVDAVREAIAGRPIDASGLVVLDAPTYRWRAQQALNRNIDLGNRDSIYDHWSPAAPAGYSGWAFVGSMRPDRQVQMASLLGSAELLAADAMLSYVRSQTPHAREVVRMTQWYFCNRDEFAALGGTEPETSRRDWGLEGLVIKDGPAGVTAFVDGGAMHVPALTDRPVVDTTGAGDAVAAGMLARWCLMRRTRDSLRDALMWGVACASIAIGDIGLRALRKASREDLAERVEEVRKLASRAC